MYNELIGLLNKRFSCRHYEPGVKIPSKDIQKIVKGAFLGPSSYGLWPYDIIIIDNPSLIKIITSTMKEHSFCKDSSLLIFVCQKNDIYKDYPDINKTGINNANEPHIDASIAGTYMDLIATSLGYNTIWMGYYENPLGRKILKLPNNLLLLYYLAIGKRKKNIKKIIFDTKFKEKTHYNRFGNKYYQSKEGQKD